MNRTMLKTKVEKITGRRDVIAWTAEVLGISNSAAALKLRGESPMTIKEAIKLSEALKLTSTEFSAMFIKSEGAGK